ncbi:MAG: glycosyltransferase family 9 protein [Acidimicrobiia bacterium]
MTSRPVVGVARPLGLGDLFTGIPSLRALRRAFPDADLVLAAPSWQTPVAQWAGVDRVLDTTEHDALPNHFAGADVLVNLHGRGPQSTCKAIGMGPKRLIAFRNDDLGPTASMPEWRADEHEVKRWCRLLTESGIPADPSDIRIATSVPVVGTDAPVVVHPGASSASRRWPVERFGAVARWLADHGHGVVVVGTSHEREMCEAVVVAAASERGRRPRRPARPVRSLAGATDLGQLVALVAAAPLVVAGDSGVAHVATATGTPSVLLFGPVSPALWGPPTDSRHRVIWKGRRGDPHASTLDAGQEAIGVDEVLAAVELVLAIRCPAEA